MDGERLGDQNKSQYGGQKVGGVRLPDGERELLGEHKNCSTNIAQVALTS